MATTNMQARVMAEIRGNVEKYGLAVMFIGGDPATGEPPFHYSIGRGKRHLPELVIVAPLSPQSGKQIINELDRLMPEKRPSGTLISLGGKYPLKLIDADFYKVSSKYTLLANHFHGHQTYEVQQVILPDAQGIFPPFCAEPYAQQPYLGIDS